jgi:hypothetical protein
MRRIGAVASRSTETAKIRPGQVSAFASRRNASPQAGTAKILYNAAAILFAD